MDIPKDWPTHGMLDGESIALTEVEALTPAERAEVEVDVPGKGVIRPWRFVDDGSNVRVSDSGKLLI
jgi:hypothetical protein